MFYNQIIKCAKLNPNFKANSWLYAFTTFYSCLYSTSIGSIYSIGQWCRVPITSLWNFWLSRISDINSSCNVTHI